MRILILTQWFDPEPTFKGLLFAKELQRQGHDVEILTGFPNYPGGRVYPGYRIRAWQREVIDDVRVLRVALYPSHSRSAFGRLLNYGSFAVTALFGVMLIRRPDIVYLYHPPGSAALPALAIKLLRKVPFVLDIQDLWPDTLAATGMLNNRFLLGAVGRWMAFVYRRAAHIVVLSNGFSELLIKRGVPAEKVTVIPNWTYGSAPSPPGTKEHAANLGFADHFNILFAGTMGTAQALDVVYGAAQRLEKSHSNVRFVLIGGGVERDRLAQYGEERQIKNVVFMERLPPSEIPEILRLADAFLVHLKDDPLFEITIPSKTQAYLRAGKPILMGVRGDAARLVQDAEAGLLFEPENAESLADAVTRLIEMPADARAAMGTSGRSYYDRCLSIEAGVSRWSRLFEQARFSCRPGGSLKRLGDILVSMLMLVLLSLPMLILAAAVAAKLGRPVLFRQERPGRYGVPFRMFKFRTMTDARNLEGELLPDRDRLTPFGAWLRRSSLDELPGLVNILRGHMSLVGPRPLVMRYTPFFTEEERLRLSVRPGVTGWAQINGRNLVSWDERLAMDVWYVKNWSLGLDIKILAKTMLRVVQRRDVVPDAESVMKNLDDERRPRVLE